MLNFPMENKWKSYFSGISPKRTSPVATSYKIKDLSQQRAEDDITDSPAESADQVGENLWNAMDSWRLGLGDLFTRIDEGFTTRPDSGAMRRHFLDRGHPETAALFRPSSMEHVRSLGGDPLTFISEMPLFLLPPRDAQRDFPDPASGTEGRVGFHRWLADLLAGRSTAEAARAAARHGIRPMPIRDQARLQLEFLDAVLATARCQPEEPIFSRS